MPRLPIVAALAALLFLSATTSLTAQVVVTKGGDLDTGLFYIASGSVQAPGATVAVGGTVNLPFTDANLELTDAFGLGVVGVYAVSQALDATQSSSVPTIGGDVTVTFSSTFNIATGTGETQGPAIGVLAISAGQGALLDPFQAHQVITHGTGAGGNVTVENDGIIGTQGDHSIGIAALSLGGTAIATNASDTSDSTNALGTSGNHSSTGDGATVKVTNTGKIVTLGGTANGIVAISAGGGGIVKNDIPPGSKGGFILGDNSSSSSDGPSNGGTVTVEHSGSIQTGDGTQAGNASIGIVAQSIGGSGGSAGGWQPSLFVGDNGGGGGAGGEVNVTTDAGSSIHTKDLNSVGILAQSIGGGGGNGANSAGLFVAVGGNGGTGGDGGMVEIDQSGLIETLADHSAGIIAQSIGGGGGHGGSAHAFGFIGSASIGGKGGKGGAGGTATVTNEVGGTITALGNNSIGMLAQSVGGGGGTGGAAISNSIGLGFSMSLALGGAGATGGAAEAAWGYNDGAITTGSETPAPGAPTGADSIGMLVQSIGGGGGHGGSAIARSFAIPAGDPPVAVTASVSLGGSGGSANAGGTAYAENTGQITTWGDGAHSILAQSIGGGGGNGGDSTAATLLFTGSGKQASLTLAHGGKAGKGGDANLVTVMNVDPPEGPAANLETHGNNAAGIVAQSIGGGGGNGGGGNATAFTPSLLGDATTAVITIGLGGKAASGSAGGSVEVTNEASITTDGASSQGILAQSIGGGGGNAGGGSAAGSGNTLTVDVTVGGTGGSGGDSLVTDGSYAVNVTNSGSVTTLGGDSVGILAQSIGGGGGTGGSADSNPSLGPLSGTNALLSPSNAYTGSVAVGKTGGDGGQGGYTFVNNSGSIATSGDRSFGILAQSISGGGGTGGTATAASDTLLFEYIVSEDSEKPNFQADVAVGGNGGDGSVGGTAQVSHFGTITTTGYGAHGIVSQSIGSGGGVGADGSIDIHASLVLGIKNPSSKESSASGGFARIDSGGLVQTTGVDATALLAQSIGGGGGLASAGVGRVTEGQSAVARPITSILTLGFDIDDATNTGPNGLVEVHQAGTLDTSGDWSHGIVAQSIGGGGGKSSTISGTNSATAPDVVMTLGGGRGLGHGGEVDIGLDANFDNPGSTTIVTRGYAAFGVLGQSIGGGGGLASDGSSDLTSIELILGGNGGSLTGDGASVSLSASGASISTGGDAAHAILLQSIGAGGGIAGTGSSIAGTTPDAHVVLGAVSSVGAGGYVSLGTQSQSAVVDVSTQGASAYGILAQSIGGGGGIAFTRGGLDSTSVLGGSQTSKDNDGGAIDLYLAAGSQVMTQGSRSHAIVVQSIGGGGGIANPSGVALETNPQVLNPSETRGYGGVVTVSVDATIQTSGLASHGILAQVIGGGGGIVGNYAGSTGGSKSSAVGADNGRLTVGQLGLILTTGINSVGIFAQNGTGGAQSVGNDIEVDLAGIVVGGSGSEGVGVLIANGSGENLVNVSGTLSAYSGVAVRYIGYGTLNVFNSGAITGDINLINILGNEGTFTNDGSYSGGTAYAVPPSLPRPFTMALVNAHFRQTRRGVLLVNADFTTGESDQIVINGDADLDGEIRVAAPYVAPLGTLPVLTITGTIEGSPVATFPGNESALFEYGVRRIDNAFHVGAIDADFSPIAFSLGWAALRSPIISDRSGKPQNLASFLQ